MPAIYAHDRFGEEVVKTLPPSFAQLYEKYTEAFRLGFQGPDILFYHQPFKKNAIRTRGTQLHITSAGGKFFREQAAILLKKAGYSEDKPYSVDEVLQANGARAAYIAGFLCHFSLDVACHPYIDGHSDEIFTHGKIESEFDKFVRRQKGVRLHGYNVAKDAIKPTGGCAETVAAVLSVPEENIRTAISTMRKINGMFTFPLGLWHGFAHIVLKIAKYERKFGDMFMHKKDDPRFAGMGETLYKKFEEAIPKASALIVEYFNGLPDAVKSGLSNEIYRYNYSGIILQTEDC